MREPTATEPQADRNRASSGSWQPDVRVRTVNLKGMKMKVFRRAAALGGAGIALIVLSACSGGEAADDAQRSSPPAAQASAPVTPLLGFPDDPDFPLTIDVPRSLTEVDEGAGTRAFVLGDTSVGLGVQALASVDERAADDLPGDISGFLRESREDVVVTDGPSATVDGRPAESFRIEMAPGAQPSDLWCPVGGACFKPLPDKPIEVLVVESSRGPLWIGMEFLPQDEELAQAAFEELVGGLRIG